jgi:hypothetical protein
MTSPSAAFEAYGFLKIFRRGEGPDQLRQEISARFARGPGGTTAITPPATGNGN